MEIKFLFLTQKGQFNLHNLFNILQNIFFKKNNWLEKENFEFLFPLFQLKYILISTIFYL